MTLDPVEWKQAEIHALSMKGCADCGRRMNKHHDSWINDDLWSKYGNNGGYLCLVCIERRIGRPLARADFPDAPCNEEIKE
jgi:hypothetical protein